MNKSRTHWSVTCLRRYALSSRNALRHFELMELLFLPYRNVSNAMTIKLSKRGVHAHHEMEVIMTATEILGSSLIIGMKKKCYWSFYCVTCMVLLNSYFFSVSPFDFLFLQFSFFRSARK